MDMASSVRGEGKSGTVISKDVGVLNSGLGVFYSTIITI